MAKIGRPGVPSEERQQAWEMWQRGESYAVSSRCRSRASLSIASGRRTGGR